ncbi:MAG: hypothetical protein ACLQU4_11000 [Limisphaerales bacterium]
MDRPRVSKKTNLICEWIGKQQCPLKKFGVVFDKTGPDSGDWRPTFFRIMNLNNVTGESFCGGQCASPLLGEPIRFDIFDKPVKPDVP